MLFLQMFLAVFLGSIGCAMVFLILLCNKKVLKWYTKRTMKMAEELYEEEDINTNWL